jgi:serine/threonine-protein kinase
MDMSDYAAARIGNTVSKKYRLERLIGVGGMAAVYEAVHRNGLHVAIKILHPQLSIDADLRTRFMREGYVANKVKHRGAVRVLDDDRAEDGSVFLVMELLEGETIDALFHRSGSGLPLREVCQLADQLLDTLSAAHDHKVVHRDIKPENLFLTSEGVLKVLDFGIARLREESAPEAATRTGRTMGTPAFMPPEQALGRSKEIDGQTDLWAVGATMFTLASGQFVHQAETVEEMIVFAGSRSARKLVEALPSAPPVIASVIDRALAKDKEHRWPHARAMRAALTQAYRDAYGAKPPVRAIEPASGLDPAAPTIDDPAFQRGTPTPEETIGTGTEIARTATPLTPLRPDFGRLSTTAGLASAARGVAADRPAARRARKTVLAIALLAVLLVSGAGGGIALHALRSRATPETAVTAAAVVRAGAVVTAAAASDAPARPSTAVPRAPERSERDDNPSANGAAPTIAPGSRPEAVPAPTTVRRRPGLMPSSPPGPSPGATVTTIPEPTPIAPPISTTVVLPPVIAVQPPAHDSTSPAHDSTQPAHDSTPPAAPTPTCRIVTSYDTDGRPHFKKVCN